MVERAFLQDDMMTKTKKRDHLNLLCDIGDLATLLTGSSNIENFLQRTTVMVSRHLEADVCSIYLFDDQTRELVLKATIGLNPEAVDSVRMKLGEGLVGCTLIKQQPIREGSASRNPQFKYFEETGEDRFESFLSVPISRGIENIGVLVVQHEKRDYFLLFIRRLASSCRFAKIIILLKGYLVLAHLESAKDYLMLSFIIISANFTCWAAHGKSS